MTDNDQRGSQLALWHLESYIKSLPDSEQKRSLTIALSILQSKLEEKTQFLTDSISLLLALLHTTNNITISYNDDIAATLGRMECDRNIQYWVSINKTGVPQEHYVGSSLTDALKQALTAQMMAHMRNKS